MSKLNLSPYAIVAIVLVLVGLTLVQFANDDEARNRERQARTLESPPPQLTADSGGFDTQSGPQIPAAADGVEATESAGDAAEALDPESAEVVPIPFPSELATWVEEVGPEGFQFHRWLERQPRAPLWADSVEADYWDLINNNPNLADIRALSIECRANACEILAVGYGDGALRAWYTEMRPSEQGPLSEEWLRERFEFPITTGCGASPMAPGVLALHCVIRPEEPEVSQTEASDREAVDVDTLSLSERMARLRAQDSGLNELYQVMQTEPTDPSWSVYMETQLSEFFTSHPELGNSNIISIECRSSLCEMQAIDSDFVNWGLVTQDFYAQGWHDLDIASVIGEQISSDQAGFIWLLQRREPSGP